MILVDANLLLYARISTFPQHQRARDWLDTQINGMRAVGMPWQCLLAFVRISTLPRLFQIPLRMSDAFQQVNDWLACETVWIPMPTAEHATLLQKNVEGSAASPNLVNDAHLATLAIEHGLTLCSADKDFARFKTLTWINPLD